jgi:hypothetical protein
MMRQRRCRQDDLARSIGVVVLSPASSTRPIGAAAVPAWQCDRSARQRCQPGGAADRRGSGASLAMRPIGVVALSPSSSTRPIGAAAVPAWRCGRSAWWCPGLAARCASFSRRPDQVARSAMRGPAFPASRPAGADDAPAPLPPGRSGTVDRRGGGKGAHTDMEHAARHVFHAPGTCSTQIVDIVCEFTDGTLERLEHGSIGGDRKGLD